jgi:hypothetical protein
VRVLQKDSAMAFCSGRALLELADEDRPLITYSVASVNDLPNNEQLQKPANVVLRFSAIRTSRLSAQRILPRLSLSF